MWFGLTGVWWFLLALGYTLVGIGVMVAAVLGLTWLVARAPAALPLPQEQAEQAAAAGSP
jgi:uncharacterized membrane protein